MTSPRYAPSFAYCAIALMVVRTMLKVRGLGATVRFTQSASRISGPNCGDGVTLTTETATRVATAAAFFPGRARCLEQSIVLQYLLRRRGIAAALRLGMEPRRPIAHAWVEVGGNPVNEGRETVRKVVPLPELT